MATAPGGLQKALLFTEHQIFQNIREPFINGSEKVINRQMKKNLWQTL